MFGGRTWLRPRAIGLAAGMRPAAVAPTATSGWTPETPLGRMQLALPCQGQAGFSTGGATAAFADVKATRRHQNLPAAGPLSCPCPTPTPSVAGASAPCSLPNRLRPPSPLLAPSESSKPKLAVGAGVPGWDALLPLPILLTMLVRKCSSRPNGAAAGVRGVEGRLDTAPLATAAVWGPCFHGGLHMLPLHVNSRWAAVLCSLPWVLLPKGLVAWNPLHLVACCRMPACSLCEEAKRVRAMAACVTGNL